MRLSVVAMVFMFSPALYAQGSPEVQVDEIIRRGDMVEHITGDIRDDGGPEGLIRQVTDTLTEKELDKWNIYVVGQKGCVPCQKLYDAWKTDPVLRAYAKPDDYKTSWANFHYYRYDDELQRWRWTRNKDNPAALEIKAFPTVVCQPPRNGKWNASDIVYAAVYPGDSKTFSRDLNAMIKAYVAKVAETKNRADEPDPEVPPPSAAKAIYSLEGNAPPGEVEPPKLGMVGQQITPLLLPNDEPEQEPEGRDRNLIHRGEQIVIVKDAEQVYGTDEEQAIQETANELQPALHKLRVREIDMAKAKKLYGVQADEVPVVLRVEGEDVREKRSPRVSSDKGWGPLMAIWFGFGGLISIFFYCIGIFILVIFWAIVIMLIIALLRKFGVIAPKGGWPAQPAPQQPTGVVAAPAAPAGKDYDAMIAEKEKQLKYEELTAKLQAAKAANA